MGRKVLLLIKAGRRNPLQAYVSPLLTLHDSPPWKRSLETLKQALERIATGSGGYLGKVCSSGIVRVKLFFPLTAPSHHTAITSHSPKVQYLPRSLEPN